MDWFWRRGGQLSEKDGFERGRAWCVSTLWGRGLRRALALSFCDGHASRSSDSVVVRVLVTFPVRLVHGVEVLEAPLFVVVSTATVRDGGR